MKAKWFSIFLILALLAITIVPAAGAAPSARLEGKGFSIVSMQPDVVQALRDQGKKINYPTPATANKGKKFNPVGDVIGQLVPPIQNVLVIFADFTTPPPGGQWTD